MKANALNRKIKKFDNDDRLYFHRYRLTNEQYHLCTQAVSSTALKDLYYNKNPQLCYQKYIAKTIQHKQSQAMLIGSATHKLILEYRSFNKEFAVWDGKRKAGNDWKDFQLEHNNKDILSMAEYDDIRRMRDAVLKHPEANKLLSGGEAEKSVFWREETGVLCRARADYQKVVKGSKILIDLKTCKTAEPEQFAKDLVNLGYPLQEAMYRDGFQADAFCFIAVEKGDYNTVEVYDLDDLFDQCGNMIYRQALEQWHECRKTETWPSYRGGISTLEPPTWWVNKVLHE